MSGNTIMINTTEAQNRRDRITQRNEVAFQLVMFEGGLNGIGIIQSASMMLRMREIFITHQPLVTRDAGKITEVAEHFSEADQSQANQMG